MPQAPAAEAHWCCHVLSPSCWGRQEQLYRKTQWRCFQVILNMANTIPAAGEWQGSAALVSLYWSSIWDRLPTAVLPNVSFHVCSPLEAFYRTISLLLEGRWQLEPCTWKMCKYLSQHPIISARKEVGTGPAVRPFQSLSGHKTHTWWSSQTLCVCDLQPAAGKCVATCPQQNSLAQNREKRMPKSQEWHWSQGVCSLGGLELFLPMPLETISLREHIILLDLPNIGLFCVTEEFLFPGQNS